MDPEIKELLEKDLTLDEENNKILRKMMFFNRISFFLNIIKWVVIVASVLGITYWLRPQLDTLVNIYRDLIN